MTCRPDIPSAIRPAAPTSRLVVGDARAEAVFANRRSRLPDLVHDVPGDEPLCLPRFGGNEEARRTGLRIAGRTRLPLAEEPRAPRPDRG